MKNFDEWNNVKKNIEKTITDFNVDKREVWWISLGINIGSEVCGKNENFERPVLVLKKFDTHNFFVLPITSTIIEGDHFYTIFMNGQDRCVMLHQGKFVNKKRFLRRIQIVSESKFDGIKKAFIDLMNNDYVKSDYVKVVYTDNLYLCSPDEAYTLKRKHQKMVANHKAGWMNLIKKNVYLIPSAYTFTNWSQLLLDCNNFDHYVNKFKTIYDEDALLQKYIQLDIENTGREVNTYTVAYMLEEILLDYMVMKGKVRMQNDYTNDKEQWVLNCYHGKPHRSHVYLHQKNFFEFYNAKNIYQNSCYDMLNKKLYNYDNLDIETFDFSKNTISELSDKISE